MYVNGGLWARCGALFARIRLRKRPIFAVFVTNVTAWVNKTAVLLTWQYQLVHEYVNAAHLGLERVQDEAVEAAARRFGGFPAHLGSRTGQTRPDQNPAVSVRSVADQVRCA